MSGEGNRFRVSWRVHVAAPVERVYDAIAAAEGRRLFWAESAEEDAGAIRFVFPDGTEHAARILRAERPRVFSIEYFDSVATFTLSPSDDGTDVLLVNEGVPEHERTEVTAGWVSVLLQLKAAVQFGVDLRNHRRDRSWAAGYADN